MTKCSFCNATILFGGERDGELRFCGVKCFEKGLPVRLGQQLPDDMVEEALSAVRQRNCPKCGGPGPIDIHTSYRVASFIKITTWSSRNSLCCSRCGRKAKLLDALYSFAFGWWGVPLGFVVTPIQIARNLFDLLPNGHAEFPSAALENMVRLDLAGVVLHSNREARARERMSEIVRGASQET